MVFAYIQVVLAVCASVTYAFDRDWPHAGYWAAGAVITYCATTMKG